MLSVTADHALRALLVLGRHFGQRPVRADEIADSTGAPRNYLAKTLNVLAKAGVVSSSRGPLGGFTLAIAPERLSLAQVVDLFDEPRAQAKCMLGTAPCDPDRPCAAHVRWTAITDARRAPLCSTTIADLLGETRGRDSPDAAPTVPEVPAEQRRTRTPAAA